MKKNRVKYVYLIIALCFQCACVTACASGVQENKTQTKINESKELNKNTGVVTTAEKEKDEIEQENEKENQKDEEVYAYDGESVEIDVKSNTEYAISSAGTYVLSGKADNFTVKVDADKEDDVQIVLSNADINNENLPVIYVVKADKCIITTTEENNMSVGGEFSVSEEDNVDAVIFSKTDLLMQGSGSLTIESISGNGIVSKDDIEITGGKYNLTCAGDGLEANDTILISGGEFDITAKEGLEASCIRINDGQINIEASDDGINATQRNEELEVLIEINGGNIKIVMGPGDTDGIDSNGKIIVNGGTIDIEGVSTFDYDSEAIYNGGTIIINGEEVDSIPESDMMGGHGGKKFDREQLPDGQMPSNQVPSDQMPGDQMPEGRMPGGKRPDGEFQMDREKFGDRGPRGQMGQER